MKKFALSLLIALSLMLTFASPVAAAPAEAAVCAQWHLVKYGETLAIVAARYGTSMSALQQLNNLANINRIFYGTYLCVRAGATGGFYYTVQSGDTLAKISVRYGWSISYLAAVNRITNINKVYVGQLIFIPSR